MKKVINPASAPTDIHPLPQHIQDQGWRRVDPAEVGRYRRGPVRAAQARPWRYPPYVWARLGYYWDRLRGRPEDPHT